MPASVNDLEDIPKKKRKRKRGKAGEKDAEGAKEGAQIASSENSQHEPSIQDRTKAAESRKPSTPHSAKADTWSGAEKKENTLQGALDRLSSRQPEQDVRSNSLVRAPAIKSKRIYLGDTCCKGSVRFAEASIKVKLKLPDEQLPVTTVLRVPADVERIELPYQPLPGGLALLRIEVKESWRSIHVQRFLSGRQKRAIDVYADSCESCMAHVKPTLAAACARTAQVLHLCTAQQHKRRSSTCRARLRSTAGEGDRGAEEPAAEGGASLREAMTDDSVAAGRRGGGSALWRGQDDSEELFTFPAGSKERDTVVVTVGDVRTLRPGHFLNDTIVDFFLKLLQARMAPQQRAQCHMFNSFFWKKLQLETEQGSPDPHRSVARWTKHVDIFAKRFIFVPICVSLHWRLAIVCLCPPSGPGSNLKHAGLDNAILYLDSMGGSLSAVGPVLSAYMHREWQTRKLSVDGPDPPKVGGPVQAPAKRKVRVVPVPQQTNGSDCGLFVLEFLARFVDDFVPARGEGEGQEQALQRWVRAGAESSRWFGVGRIPQLRQELLEQISTLAASRS